MAGLKRQHFTPRVVVYLFLIFISASGLIYSVSHRSLVDLSILRGHDQPYTFENNDSVNGKVLNHFKINLKNQEFHDIKISYEIVAADLNSDSKNNIAHRTFTPSVEMISPINPVTLKPGELQRIPVFFRFDRHMASNAGQFKIKIRFKEITHFKFTAEQEVNLVAPLE